MHPGLSKRLETRFGDEEIHCLIKRAWSLRAWSLFMLQGVTWAFGLRATFGVFLALGFSGKGKGKGKGGKGKDKGKKGKGKARPATQPRQGGSCGLMWTEPLLGHKDSQSRCEEDGLKRQDLGTFSIYMYTYIYIFIIYVHMHTICPLSMH